MNSLVGCFCLKRAVQTPVKDYAILASETIFTVNEIEALYGLYKNLSSLDVNDGRINKEVFLLGLFNNRSKQSLFADRLFELFDHKQNGIIDFEQFVRSLSIFHPDAPEIDKIAFLFRLYDLRHTGYIERAELKEMVLAILSESDLTLADDAVEAIVDKTIQEADLKADGRIDPDEWKELVVRNPSVLKNMTLPFLREITLAFPHFVLESEVLDSELAS